jgi:hypothetical protein
MFPSIRGKRHAVQAVLLLGMATLVAFWAVVQLTPPIELGHESEHNGVKPKGNRMIERMSSSIIHTETNHPREPTRMLLSTHNRLFWYYPETKKEVDVHKGQVRDLPEHGFGS